MVQPVEPSCNISMSVTVSDTGGVFHMTELRVGSDIPAMSHKHSTKYAGTMAGMVEGTADQLLLPCHTVVEYSTWLRLSALYCISFIFYAETSSLRVHAAVQVTLRAGLPRHRQV